MESVRRLRLPGLISDLDAISLISSGGVGGGGGGGVIVPPSGSKSISKGSKGAMSQPPSLAYGRNGSSGGGDGRRTHRMPSRQACGFVMAKLLIGGSCIILNLHLISAPTQALSPNSTDLISITKL